jgi:hypothetical protein
MFTNELYTDASGWLTLKVAVEPLWHPAPEQLACKSWCTTVNEF